MVGSPGGLSGLWLHSRFKGNFWGELITANCKAQKRPGPGEATLNDGLKRFEEHLEFKVQEISDRESMVYLFVAWKYGS